jgi:hypothetical protein
MARELKPLPPDHPLFTRGVSFVFRGDPPAEQDESEHDDGEEQEPERD